MVRVAENIIVQGEKVESISSYQVWWAGPTGISPDKDQMIQEIERLEMPVESIRPIVVAVSPTMAEMMS